MSVDLKPCPFCGGKACKTQCNDDGDCRVRCQACLAESPTFNDDDELAADIWNTRHEAAKEAQQHIAGSSNGRTADFESANDGSSPSPASNDQPVELPPDATFGERIVSKFTALNPLEMGELAHEIDRLQIQLEAELKWRRDNDND